MWKHGDLAHGGTEFALAKPGESYIAYASALVGDLGLKGMTEGLYDFVWFEPATGNTVSQTGVAVPAGDRTWTRPGPMRGATAARAA